MSGLRILAALFPALLFTSVCHAQLGKNVVIPAGSDMDHELTAINNADPSQRLQLIDQLSQAHPEGDYQIIVDEQYVNYYLSVKQYDKVFEYGDKLFGLDADNYVNAINMVRAANEQKDTDKLFRYGEKANAILQRYKDSPPPSGSDAEHWQRTKNDQMASLKDDQDYVRESLFSAAYNVNVPLKKADYFERFGKIYAGTAEGAQAFTMAAVSYQQAQNRTKMLDVANSALTLDPDNVGILLLLADDFSEKGEQLDKAEAYAKKAASLMDTAKKPDNVSDEQWQGQLSLQKGLAFTALGQINMEKKLNAQAVNNLTKAAPLLKSNPITYARNQYRLGFAYLNLRKTPEAKQAFLDAASVNSPYKTLAQRKLSEIADATHKKPS
jgi:tetratricopeptide (TPR) repeat protein